MSVAGLMMGLVALGQAAHPPRQSTADAVTLRDGKVVLGQWLESDRRAPLVLVVRREWARSNLPERLAVWEKLEAPLVRKAEAQRRERLLAWKGERRPDPAGGERINAWIDRELARLEGPDAGAKSALMVVKLARSEVKAIDRRPAKDNRILRLGWLSSFQDVEAMPRDELARALEGRGFAPDAEMLVSVDSLLPIPAEADARWLVRRAATEVLNDPGGRLLRHQGLLLPEPAAGEAPPAASSLNAALGTIKELLGETPVDPLPGKLRELARLGKVGVVVTQLDMAPDFSSVAVEATLWVGDGERWVAAVVRSATVRPDELPADAWNGLADDPQVKAAFGVIETLGLGEIPPELKRRSLGMGAATKKALGQAKGTLEVDLDALGLSLEAPRPAPPATGPAIRP